MGLFKLIFGTKSNSEIFDFERDYNVATNKQTYNSEKSQEEVTLIGTANQDHPSNGWSALSL